MRRRPAKQAWHDLDRKHGWIVISLRQPVGESCLTYAYALYDLGRALALIGHRAEAVSVLERRLQIDNQRATVAAELERARAQAG
jgi:hypothetical protein